jgi:asparagine synthase (glutamine-hydrolysing)
MKESLEVRVPMLDEELFAFGLSLPPHLKVKGRTRKRVLRAVAQRQLPPAVAKKPKRGFGVPVDSWVDAEFKARVREILLGTSSRVAEFYRPEAYRPIVEAFYNGYPCRDLSRSDIYNRVIQLLAAELTLGGTSVHGPHWSPP